MIFKAASLQCRKPSFLLRMKYYFDIFYQNFPLKTPASLGSGMKAAFVFLSQMMEKKVTNFLKTKAFLSYCYKQLRKEERLLCTIQHS